MPQDYVGRVVIELGADNNIYMEHYTNGARTRTKLDRGAEWWNILDELTRQRKSAQSQAERQQERKDAEAIAQYNKVYATTAKHHGTKFANTHIGKPYGTNFVAEPKPPIARPTLDRELLPNIDNTAIADMVRVCHCGEEIVPFMEKCPDCPGHSGAGKIARTVTRITRFTERGKLSRSSKGQENPNARRNGR